MQGKHVASEHYLKTHDDEARQDALQEAADTKKRWRLFLEGVSSITKLVTGPLYAVSGAALLAAMAVEPVVPMAVGIGLLVAATVSLVTAVTTGYAISSLERADAVIEADMKAKMHSKQMMQEIRTNGLCLVPEKELPEKELTEKELDVIKEVASSPCPRKDWSQRIQTAELNEAAQRSIH